MNILYVIPRVDKVSGGPRTRITAFSRVFENNGDTVIMGKNKFRKSLTQKKMDLVYIESATNRISTTDFISLLYLRLRSKKRIVFIRDVYIELFPEEFRSPRKRITWALNKLSNFFLTAVSTQMAFPTVGMGAVFFEKNKWFPKRDYFALPPGCTSSRQPRNLPDFTKKLGILYLGSISYANAGFENFIQFADTYPEAYNYFVLSGDSKVAQTINGREYIVHDRVDHSHISTYVEKHNIAIAYHTRPRNAYDDITFPIKILDFIGFQLPFITDKHVPLAALLGDDYSLFVDVSNYDEVDCRIQSLNNKNRYTETIDFLARLAENNTYEERYKRLLQA